MARVFISYSHRNSDRVDALVSELDRLGVNYWRDRNDIPVSVSWFQEVRAAIQETDFLVACGSPEYQRSEQCQVELAIAHELGKRILVKELLVEDVRLVAATIAAAVRDCPPEVRTHTELITRSATWERSGRDRGMLISGGPLRDAQQLARRQGVVVPPVAVDFVRASRRRQRRLRRWTALGVTVVTLAGLLVLVSGLVQSALQKSFQDNLDRFVALHREPEPNIYRELVVASRQARTEKYAELNRLPLVRALNVPLPDRSYVVPGDPLTGFAAAVATAPEPAVSRAPRAPTAVPALPGTSSGAVAAVADSPGSALLAVSFVGDGLIRVYSRPALTLTATMTVPATASPLAFSANSRFLAVGVGPDVWIHDVRTGTRVTQLRGSAGAVRDLAWSADGGEVWALAGDHRVSGWRWRTGRVLIDDPSLWFVSVAGPADTGEFAVTTRDGRIFRVNGTTTTETRTSARDTVSAALSRDASQVVIGTQDSLLVRDSQGEHPIALENCVPTGVSFAPNGRLIYVACFNRTEIRAYASDSGKLAGSAKLTNTAASSVTTDARGTVFVGGVYGEIIALPANLATQQVVLRTSCDVPIRAIKSNKDGSVLVQAGDGGGGSRCMVSANLVNGTWVPVDQILTGETGEQGRAVGITARGDLAASGYSDGTVAFWTPGTETPSGNYHDFGGEVRGIAFTPDGANILVSSRDGVLELMDACPLCRTTPELIRMAGERVARADQLGLR